MHKWFGLLLAVLTMGAFAADPANLSTLPPPPPNTTFAECEDLSFQGGSNNDYRACIRRNMDKVAATEALRAREGDTVTGSIRGTCYFLFQETQFEAWTTKGRGGPRAPVASIQLLWSTEDDRGGKTCSNTDSCELTVKSSKPGCPETKCVKAVLTTSAGDTAASYVSGKPGQCPF